MKTKSIGKVVAGVVFILCFGLDAHSKSSPQKEAGMCYTEVVSLERDGGAGDANAGTKVRHKHSKVHRAYAFKVLFKNGTEKEVTGRIKFEKEDSTYVLVSKGEVIKAADTQYISRIDKASGARIVGISKEKQWLFPVIEGRINGYSTYAENCASFTTHISPVGSKEILSFETDKKHEREQAVEVLAEMIRGNVAAEQVMREHQRKARRKELTKNIALGGLGFTVLGIAVPPFATAFVVGVPLGFGAGLASVSLSTVDLVEVISTYNDNVPVIATTKTTK